MIGHVYEIVNRDSSIRYVGSTMKSLQRRWAVHRNMYKAWLKNPDYTSICLYAHVDNIDNFQMNLLRTYEVIDKFHLRTKEQLWMKKLPNINKIDALNLIRRIVKKIYARRYYADHKNEYTYCKCGHKLKRFGLRGHWNTQKHKRRMETIMAYAES